MPGSEHVEIVASHARRLRMEEGMGNVAHVEAVEGGWLDVRLSVDWSETFAFAFSISAKDARLFAAMLVEMADLSDADHALKMEAIKNG